MAGRINTFRDELITLLGDGFVLNGRQFFGNGAGEVFSVMDYMDVEIPMRLAKEFPSTVEEFALSGPWVLISNIKIANTTKVGGHLRYQLRVTLDVAFADEHRKVVDGDEIRGDSLSYYFEEQLRDSVVVMTKFFPTSSVRQVERIDGGPQQFDHDGNLVYGTRFIFECEVR